MNNEELCKAAIGAMCFAYVPYSRHKVGAALLCKDGTLFTGCNVENAAYGPTNCAERTAVFKAVSEGHTDFQKIAVCGGKDGVIGGAFPPCGVCRQVLREFCGPDFPVLVIQQANPLKYETYTLGELLPHGFSPADLK